MPPGTWRRSCSTARSTDGVPSAMPTRRIAIELLEAGTAPLPREPGGPGGPRRDEPGAQGLVRQARVERPDERAVVAGVDHEGTVPEDLGQRAGAARHHGHTGPHGLQ